MVMTKMPPRPPSKKREHKVMAKPDDYVAGKGKRFKLLSSDEESDGILPRYQPPPKKKHDPRANVDMGSQNSGPSEHSYHSGQEPDD